MEVINNYITSNQTNEQNKPFVVEELIQFIYSNMVGKSPNLRIHFKKYPEDNLVQIFTESSQEYTRWDIYNVCRSIVLQLDTGKVVSFSHSNLQYLTYDEANPFFTPETKFSESHEGTLISAFFHNDKWYYATRRNISMYNTHQFIYGKKSELSHGQMFEECLTALGTSKSDLENIMNKETKYYFELVHWQSCFNMSYVERFGEKYAKVFLLFTRDNKNNYLSGENSVGQIVKSELLSAETIKDKLEDKTLKMEGFIFEHAGHLCKVLHPGYSELIKLNPGYKTKQELYIHLYQKDLLAEYVTKNNQKVYTIDTTNVELPVNVDSIGLLSCMFTYVGQRLLDIYFKFNNNNMVHRNEELFDTTFRQNKTYSLIFYTLGKMKGIHKVKPININEVRKMLKYKMTATEVWKLSQEIRAFETDTKLLNAWTNKLVDYFWV